MLLRPLSPLPPWNTATFTVFPMLTLSRRLLESGIKAGKGPCVVSKIMTTVCSPLGEHTEELRVEL